MDQGDGTWISPAHLNSAGALGGQNGSGLALWAAEKVGQGFHHGGRGTLLQEGLDDAGEGREGGGPAQVMVLFPQPYPKPQ